MHNLKACEGFFCLLRTLAGNVKIIITENWFIINYLNFLSFENGNLFCCCIPKPHLIGNLALLEINICTYMRNIFPKCAFSFTCCLDLCSIHLRHSTVMPCLMLCAVMISRGNPRYKCIQHVHGNLDWQISVLSLIPVPSKFVIASDQLTVESNPLWANTNHSIGTALQVFSLERQYKHWEAFVKCLLYMIIRSVFNVVGGI